MPVIGRLDDQVEAILINPLRRPTADEAEREPTAITPTVSEERDDADSEREKREADSPLPVWLL
ncbi:MAG TPA: hypothetical protein VIQ24_03920 [Pyrinomonadaceae bacterium]